MRSPLDAAANVQISPIFYKVSRKLELAAAFPLHTVCTLIGNTKAIAARHYLQVTDADWSRATEQKAAQKAVHERRKTRRSREPRRVAKIRKTIQKPQ